jgi:hypothetical protein
MVNRLTLTIFAFHYCLNDRELYLEDDTYMKIDLRHINVLNKFSFFKQQQHDETIKRY